MSVNPGNIAIATPPGQSTLYLDPTQDQLDMLAILQAPIPPQAPTIAEQLYTLFLSLSVSDQVLYAPYMGTINTLVINGNIQEAKLIISGITVDSQDQTVQQQMIGILS